MRTHNVLMILVALVVLTAAGPAHASPTLIGSIIDGVNAPTRVAVDSRGNVYVSETDKSIVNKYDSTGKKVGAINVYRPYGVAVTSDGTIYVCSMQVPTSDNGYKNYSAVFVYSAELVKTGTLGAEQGEFEGPVDITVGADGAVYVSDMKKGAVRVYSAPGAYQYSIGSGYLRRDWTKGVAVNDAANSGSGEVYVVDTVVEDVQGNPVDRPRISVFTRNGAFLRSFGQYGTEVGKMTSPHSIAVGRDGLLYVADSGNSVVHVLSPADGTPVGEGGLYAAYVYRPSGVAVTRSNVAYVAWQSGRVDLFGLDGYVTMSVAPSSLTFSARQYAGDPSAQTVTISNAGAGTLNWTTAAEQSWLIPGSPVPVGPTGSAELSVGVDTSALASGTYHGTVTITSEFGQIADVGVDLTVTQPLLLNISDWSPTITVKKGSGKASTDVVISIDGGAGSWSLDTSALPPWLSLSPVSGTETPTTVTFTADPTGLVPQAEPYTALVPVSAPGAVGDGSKITVSLTVNGATAISVTTNRPDAAFQVSGPASYTGSGKDWVIEDVPAGDYTITFGSVEGYRTPAPETKTLPAGGAISFSGVYVSYKELASQRNIIVARGPGATDDARIKVYKNNGAPVPFDLVALDTLYGASVAAGDVDGDGMDDIIVGAGKGQNNPAVVRVFRAYDQAKMAEFTAFSTTSGAGVAAADLNNDGKAEIIVSDNAGSIAVYTAQNGSMVPTGIQLAGRHAVAAERDGDGRPEIVTATEAGLQVWSIGSAGAAGTWTATPAGAFPVMASSLAAADTDGDGQDEIIAGIDGADGSASSVVIVETNGAVSSFATFSDFGVVVAGADLDGDGNAEIIAGAGTARAAVPAAKAAKMTKRDDDPSWSGNREEGTVRVYTSSGTLKYVIRAFDTATEGVSLAVGGLGL